MVWLWGSGKGGGEEREEEGAEGTHALHPAPAESPLGADRQELRSAPARFRARGARGGTSGEPPAGALQGRGAELRENHRVGGAGRRAMANRAPNSSVHWSAQPANAKVSDFSRG